MQNKKKLRLFFADITHDYIALASGSFPLGIGYVASALKSVFANEIEVDLFKYSGNLDQALKENRPDVYLFSSFMWNQNINLFYAQKIKESFPDTLIIGGGPNISGDHQEQKKFLTDHPFIDLYVIGEGEVPACSIIRNYIDAGKNISRLKEGELPSALTLLPDGSMKEGAMTPRIGEKRSPKETYTAQWNFLDDSFTTLGDVPSPYSTGIMDKFFDNQLFPLVETNRGCPFACSFCHQGEDYFNRTIMRPLDMIKEELDYIAYHMVKKSPGVFRIELADANFAMFKQDLEICEHINMLQDKYSWPLNINCSTGKNKPERVMEAVSKLYPNSLIISNSMQSNNLETLKVIRRENISLEKYAMIQTEMQKRGLRTQADLILGLPLETKETHFSAIYDLIDSGVQEFVSYQAMVLKDTDLASQSKRTSYGLKSKWRLIPRSIGRYGDAQDSLVIQECEEIIIATDTFSFESYMDARRLHLIDFIYHNSDLFNLIYAYLQERRITPSKFINQIYLNSFQGDFPLKGVIDDFIEKTKGELFDSEESCAAFYSKPENLKKVKNGELGGNLLFQHLAIALFEEWDSTIDAALIAFQNLAPDCENDLEDLAKILSARVVNINQTPLIKSILIEVHSQNIIELLNKIGHNFEQGSAGNLFLKMELSNALYEIVTNAKKVYPNNLVGWTLILARERLHSVRREYTRENCLTYS